MIYTVKQLAKASGISVRAIHFYDEVGLLKPSFIKPNGYRCYEDKELLRLQQILFYRELEFSVDDIYKILNSEDFDMEEALISQRKLLELKQTRIDELVKTIDKTLKHLRGGGKIMNTDDIYGGFSKKQMDEYKEEAKQRWGETEAWKQSQERTKNWTKSDYDLVAKEGDAWTQKMADLMEKGFPHDSSEVQTMIGEHYNALRTFYEPNYEMYTGLSQMYVDDPRFAAYYEKFGKGLSLFMRDAMLAFVVSKTGK
jgi:MerR family transcriptional regulator, thiopeptide resistance regulator